MRGDALFGRRSASVVGGAGFYAGDQDRFEIFEYDPRGNLHKILRLPTVDLAISELDLATAGDHVALEAPEASRERFRAAVIEQPRPTTKPA